MHAERTLRHFADVVLVAGAALGVPASAPLHLHPDAALQLGARRRLGKRPVGERGRRGVPSVPVEVAVCRAMESTDLMASRRTISVVFVNFSDATIVPQKVAMMRCPFCKLKEEQKVVTI